MAYKTYIINFFGKATSWEKAKKMIPAELLTVAEMSVPPWEKATPQRIYDECIELRRQQLAWREE